MEKPESEKRVQLRRLPHSGRKREFQRTQHQNPQIKGESHESTYLGLGHPDASLSLAAGRFVCRRISDRRVGTLPRHTRAAGLYPAGADCLQAVMGFYRLALCAIPLVSVQAERNRSLCNVAA